MPELPEVQTTVNGINTVAKGLTISAAWTDLAKEKVSRADYTETIKSAQFFKAFTKAVVGAKILRAERRAKNILIHLSTGDSILIHMKMTGHIMYGSYSYDAKKNEWTPSDKEKNEALRDPFNRFLHFVISFTNGKQLVLSDVRKFAKVTLVKKDTHHETKHLDNIGPEPLAEDFTYETFVSRLSRKAQGKVKPVLMDQSVIAGVGNIYSDEALWLAHIHPETRVRNIPAKHMKELFTATLAVLKKGIDFGGDSTSDYRQIDGTRGEFSHQHNAYRRTGKKCMKRGCDGDILRIVVGGRSAHFCGVHQTLFEE